MGERFSRDWMSFTPLQNRNSGRGGDFNSQPGVWIAKAKASQFYRAARISLITIHALILREAITRYGVRSAGYIWALIQPLVQLFMMMTFFGLLGRSPAVGDSLVIFFMTGIMPLFLFRMSIIRGARAIQQNRALMNYPQVRGFEVITARSILEATTNFCVVLLVMMFMKAFHGLPLTSWISNPLELLCALATLQLLCYGSCFLSAQIGRVVRVWADLTSFTGRMLFFTSGLWYTLASLPPNLRKFIMLNPLAQVIEWIRDAAIGGFESELFNPWYPLSFGVVCLAAGLMIEWLIRLGRFDIP